MKKLTSIIMCVVLLVCGFIVPVGAEGKDWTQEEELEGFRFNYLYVTVKDEYTFKFDEFTPAMFNEELVESVEELYPYDPDREYTYFQHFLKLNVKEPSAENIVLLYMLLQDNKYVEEIELAYISHYVPIYPESADKVPHYTGAYTPWVRCIDGSEETIRKNMLYNPYYQSCYNNLLTYSEYVYSSVFKYIGDVDYISYYADTYIDETPCYVTLIFEPVDVTDEEKSIREENLEILNKYFSEEDILYVGDTVNAAVVCVDSADSDTLVNMQELKFIGDAFFSDMGSGGVLCATGQYMLGDVYGKKDVMSVEYDTVTAADARYILRYSAGLVKPDELKRFYFCADMNFDNKINSADARLALRTAAGLEKEYEIQFGYSIYWSDFMADIVLENLW